MVTQSCVLAFQMLDFETSKSEVSNSNLWRITSLQNYVTSEGAVSHNVLYHLVVITEPSSRRPPGGLRYRNSGLYGSFLKGQGHQGNFSLVKEHPIRKL